MSHPTKILQVITDTDRRGAQIFALDLEQELRARGLEVRTVALAGGNNPSLLNVKVLGPTRRAPRTLRALRHEVLASHIVVGHGSSTLVACAIATFGINVPFVYRQISDSRFWASTAGRRMRVKSYLRRAELVVALWGGAAETLTGYLAVPRNKIVVIPNGVPAQNYPPTQAGASRAARAHLRLAQDVRIAGYIGALVPEKGVDLAVEAVARIPDLQLVVAGDGPERAWLERLADTTAPGRVHFLGHVMSPREVYDAVDVLVLPSKGGDSMPAVLIEAGLCELAVVATPVEGIVDIVVHGETGELAPLEDADGLAAGIRTALANSSRYGPAARAHCLQNFEIGVVGDAWERLLLSTAL